VNSSFTSLKCNSNFTQCFSSLNDFNFLYLLFSLNLYFNKKIMIVISKKLKSLTSGLRILFFFIFASASACSTPSKKEAESTNKVESTSTESAEHPSENSNEHPSDSLSKETSGSEHPSDDAADSEHPK